MHYITTSHASQYEHKKHGILFVVNTPLLRSIVLAERYFVGGTTCFYRIKVRGMKEHSQALRLSLGKGGTIVPYRSEQQGDPRKGLGPSKPEVQISGHHGNQGVRDADSHEF